MVDPAQGPDPLSHALAPNARRLNAAILHEQSGATPQGRQELISIIARNGSREQLEEAATRLRKTVNSDCTDLPECLSALVEILTRSDISAFQLVAVKMATRTVHAQLKKQLMAVAFEDSVPEKKQLAERQLPPLDIIDKLQSQRAQALIHHDLGTIVFFVEQAGKSLGASNSPDSSVDKITSARSVIERFLLSPHAAGIPDKLLQSLREIARDPARNSEANAAMLRDYSSQLPSVDKVGQNCLKILQEQPGDFGSLEHLDHLDRTRVRIGAARILKEFKHISSAVRHEYSAVTGKILPTLGESVPERWLALEMSREAA